MWRMRCQAIVVAITVTLIPQASRAEVSNRSNAGYTVITRQAQLLKRHAEEARGRR